MVKHMLLSKLKRGAYGFSFPERGSTEYEKLATIVILQDGTLSAQPLEFCFPFALP